MRMIHEHENNLANRQIQIEVVDEPGHGGACHNYAIHLPDLDDVVQSSSLISFQNGPIKEAGVNGLTHEVLLAILIDRLRGFQKGPFTCRENSLALTKLEEGLMWLHKRTQRREAEGVEGTRKL